MNTKVFIENINKRNAIPSYANPGDAGVDGRANVNTLEFPDGILISPGERVKIPLGIKIAMEDNIQCEVRPRSGLALRDGITVLNSPGTIN